MNRTLQQTYILLVFSFALLSCNSNQSNTNFEIKQGDLLFQNTGTGEIDNAIKEVTPTLFSKNYSHAR